MQGSDQAVPGASSRLGQMVQLAVKALLARSPAYVWRVLRVAFSPSLILRKLALVSLLQLLAYALNPADACAPGPPLPYVRATRTSLPRWVRTGGAGRPDPWALRAYRTYPRTVPPQALKLLLRAQRQNPLTGDRSSRGMERAITYDEWEKAHREHLPQQLAPLPPELQLYAHNILGLTPNPAPNPNPNL